MVWSLLEWPFLEKTPVAFSLNVEVKMISLISRNSYEKGMQYMEFIDNSGEMVFSGSVMATEWDDDDNITALEILSEDEYYFVEKNALWDELVDLWQEDVEITGIVTEERDGSKRVLITSYEILDEINYDGDDILGYDEIDDGIHDDMYFDEEETEVQYLTY